MLDLRPNCECCNADLPPESLDARICSFECTFCVACAEGPLGGNVPIAGANSCGDPGGLRASWPRHPRPPRASSSLRGAPASRHGLETALQGRYMGAVLRP
jgi:uncharacterized protein